MKKPTLIFNFFNKKNKYMIHPKWTDEHCNFAYDLAMHDMSKALKCDESDLRVMLGKLINYYLHLTKKNANQILIIPFIQNREKTLAKDIKWYRYSTVTLKNEVSFFKKILNLNPSWETFLFFRVRKKKKLL